MKVKFSKKAIKKAKQKYFKDNEFVLSNKDKVLSAKAIINNFVFDDEYIDVASNKLNKKIIFYIFAIIFILFLLKVIL